VRPLRLRPRSPRRQFEDESIFSTAPLVPSIGTGGADRRQEFAPAFRLNGLDDWEFLDSNIAADS
jgi:hypothetical protein